MLLVTGSALAGVALTNGRHVAARIAGAILVPVLFLVVAIALDRVGAALLATPGTWWYDEVGIFLSAVVALAAGVLLLVRGRRAAHPRPEGVRSAL